MSTSQFILFLGGDSASVSKNARYAGNAMGWDVEPWAEGLSLVAGNRVRHFAMPEITQAWLIGTIFPRHGPGLALDDHDGPLIAALSSPETSTLLERFWGGYLAVRRLEAGYAILRDPSAAMPCYYVQNGGQLWVTNSVPALVEAGLLRPAIEWDDLARCLYSAGLPSIRTAVSQVGELLPGDELHVKGGKVEVFHRWSPWDHVAIDGNVDLEEYAVRLRRVTESSISAWSRQFKRILVTVSGGLDSSIVAASCRQRSADLTAVTLATDGRDGDERIFARELCEHLSLRLVEARYDLADMTTAKSACAALPRPIGRSPALAYDLTVARIAATAGTDAIFTGNGGDNVFAFSQSVAAIVDRVRHQGMANAVWTIRDICLLTGCSAIEAIIAAIRLAGRGSRYVWQPDRRLIAHDILAQFDSQPLSHPWLDAPAKALRGSVIHIAALLRIQAHLDGSHRCPGVVVVNPLMAQPIIEQCLSIPSWHWCAEGRNRAVARIAFADTLPSRILNRMSKGGPDSFGIQFFTQYRSEIAERLLDGHLARRGLIDRMKIEQLLLNERPDVGPEQTRLLQLIDTEAWIDHWQHLGQISTLGPGAKPPSVQVQLPEHSSDLRS